MANSFEIIKYKQQIGSMLINCPEIVELINNKDIDGIPELDANMNTYDTRDMAHAYAQTDLKSVGNVHGSTLNERLKSDWGNTIQENKFTEEGLHNLIMESLVKVLKEL